MRPTREHATNTGQTYTVTSATWDRRSLFRDERWSGLLIEALYHYLRSAFMLHEFVVMPDHVHVLITPKTSLEKALQFIKGGFSYRAKKELGSNLEVWQRGFSDHRVRDAADYMRHVAYIRENPVCKRLSERVEEYPYSLAHPPFELDAVAQELRPVLQEGSKGAPEGAPFQGKKPSECVGFATLQDNPSVAMLFEPRSGKIAS